uniref:Annexin n=1 Tax=Glycine max TaxID=3847 RepID=C6TCN0_SOYBN|nr:unknown [Glycine max]
MATLIAPITFSPGLDAEALRKAFQGWGTDEKTVIAILGHRNVHQRQQIRKVYEEIYQEDLIKRLESELSGDFERAVYRWMLEPADRDAVLANVAIKNGSKGYHVIVEIACVLSADEVSQ